VTTLAEAAVEITADTQGFEEELRRGLQSASSTAERASQDVGSGIGRNITSGTRKALGGLGRVVRQPLDALGNRFQGLSATMQKVGSVASGAFSRVGRGVSTLTTSMGGADSNAKMLQGTLSRIGGLGAGLAAAVGIGQLGADIGRVAASAQTTEASLTALYEASGAGAAEVNETMDEMSERFRGLDMSVMNEGATTLAYMGLQGTEAVDVLERLDAATTAAGTGTTGMTRALDAMTKGVNAGKFQMGELSQISNAGIPIYDALAEVLGVDVPEAQSMASAGAVELEHVLEALSGEAGTWFPALLEGAEDVSNTFAGSWDTIYNTFVNGIANELVPVLDNLAPVLQGVASGVEGAFARLPGAVDSVTEAVTDSGAWDTFSAILDGIGEVLEALQPAFSGFASGAGAAGRQILDLVGHLQPAGSALGSLADYLSENEGLVRSVGAALGGMVTVLAVWRAGALAASLASHALSLGLRGIGVAIRGIPLIGWVLAAIGALIALYQTSDRFREIVDTAFTRVRDAVVTAWGAIEPVWDAMSSALSDLWDAVSGWEGWQTAWDAISAAVEMNWQIISGVWDSLTGAWDSLTTSTSDTSWWEDTWDTITSVLEGAWDVIGPIIDTIQGAMGLLSGALAGEADFGDLTDFAGDSFGNLQDVGSAMAEGIISGLRALPGMILDHLGAVGSTIFDFFGALPGRVADLVGADDGWVAWLADLPGRVIPVLQDFGQTILDHLQAIPEWVSQNIDPEAIIDWLREVPGRIADAMSEYGPSLLKGFGAALLVVVAGIPTLFMALLAAILVVLGTIAIELAQWAWGAFSNMMSVAGQAVMSGINSIVAWFAALPGRILAAVVSFGAQLAAWGLGAIASLRAVLVTGMNAIRSWWSGIWSGIFLAARTLWDNFVTWGAGAASRLREAIMTPVDSLKTRMVGAFEAAKEGIKSAWDTVKDVVGEPIGWVVNTAYNDWLRGVWGKVVEQFGGPSLPEMTVAFARGGTMPGGGGGSSSGVFPGYTPGRDVHAMPMAAFSGGESVLRPEITKAWGAKTTLMLNKLARTGGVGAVRKALGLLSQGHNPFTGRSVPTSSGGRGGGGFAQQFSLGGILGSVSGSAAGAAAWLSGKAEAFGEGMMDFLEDPGGTLQALFDEIMDYSKMPHWGTGFTDVLKGVPEKIIELLVEKAKSLFSIDGDADWAGMGGNVGGRLGAALAFAKSQAGKPYVWGGAGPGGYDCCLVGSTLVQCPDGLVRIDELRAGDMVSSHEEGRVTERRVAAQWFSRRQRVYTVRTRVGEVTGSDNHPFLVLDSDGGATWRRLDELAPGMGLLTPEDGRFTTALIESITAQGEQDTYDIEVEGSHNFIADGVVVHNSGFMGSIHNVILGQNPYRRRYSTHGFNGSRAHGFRRNMPSPFTIGNTHASVGHMAGTLLGTNVESRGSAGVVVGPRARGTRNSLFTSRWGLMAAARAASGERLAGEGIAFDSGGLLPRGYSLTYNGTRSPETIRTAAQEGNVERLVKLVGSQYGPRGAGAALVPAGREREFARAVGGELPVGGTTVNAPVTVTTYAADPETVAYRTAARISRLAGI